MTLSDSIRWLVVDDQRDLADNLVELLCLEGFDAHVAYDGREALAAISAFRPDGILFDIAMPGIDGLQLARELRASYGDDIVLVAMTGNVENARAADTFEVVDHYFAKPFDIAQLLKILRP